MPLSYRSHTTLHARTNFTFALLYHLWVVLPTFGAYKAWLLRYFNDERNGIG